MTNSNPQKPLEMEPEQRVTLEQLKHRAESVSNLAVNESKRVTSEIMEQDVTRTVLIAVGTLVVVASFAYFLGRRASRVIVDAVSDY